MNKENFAVQVALKTLKERCDHLQNKLELVEEENCHLKLQMSQEDGKKSPRILVDTDQLHLQIALLTEQKAKLYSQVQLITSENQKLWSRLSKLACESENFERKPFIKDSRFNFMDDNSSYLDSDLGISKGSLSQSNGESLEEISLKLDTHTIEKKEFSPDYSGDICVMKNSLQMENCAFSPSNNVIPLMNNFKDHIVKLRQFKQILQNNKTELSNAINWLKKFPKNTFCNECKKILPVNCDELSNSVIKACSLKDSTVDISSIQVEYGKEVTEVFYDDALHKICPLCGESFLGSNEEFHIHVNDHFTGSEYEPNDFELIP